MPRLTHKTLLYGAAGAFGGSAAWMFVLLLSAAVGEGLLTELMLGALAGMFIGGFIWSREALAGRQFRAAIKRAVFGAVAGCIGGAAGAGLGNTLFTTLGTLAAEYGGFLAKFGIVLSVAMGWAVLGALVGLSGGLMIRSRERALYGFIGGALGGLFGGALFNELSATSMWSALAGLVLLGLSIGSFISLVEEIFVSARVKVIKGRHMGREYPLLKDMNVVGRDDRSDVCLSGAEGVGMRHAVIRRNRGGFFIETDDQRASVYVNQKMTKSSSLSDGDVVRVGSVLLLFTAIMKATDTVFVKAAARAAVILVILLGAAGGAFAAQAGKPATMQITQFDLGNFPLVKAYVSLLDAEGRPVRGQTKDSVKLRENNQEVAVDGMQLSGTSGLREPLSLAIVLDRSGSMTGEKIERARDSVLRFISLMEPGDCAALFAFSDEVDTLQLLTSSQDSLRKSVLGISPSGHTALYDAIARGVESVRGVSGRRAVIVLTDGISNRGALDIDQAIESAAKAYVSVSVIGLGQDVRTGRLERIAQETGGTYFFTPRADGLAEIYSTISNRIRNEYVITYRTQKRADYLRNVSLVLGTGQRAVRAYFQPESSLFGAAGRPPVWAFVIPLLSILGFTALSLGKPEQQHAMAHLSLVRGSGTKKDLDIGSSVTIGRDERNALGLFRDNGIAQRHAEVVQENGRYIIEDKGSATGTFVNKTKVIGRQMLEDGDVINVGQAAIVFNEQSLKTCTGCGSTLRPGAKFCGNCGRGKR